MVLDGLYKELTYKIIGAVFEVHKVLGSAHKEIIYHKALAIELKNRGMPFFEEKSVGVKYKEKNMGFYRPDFIIDDKVILEIKVAQAITKVMRDQVYYYIRGTKYKLVLLVNFGTPRVGIKRLIYT